MIHTDLSRSFAASRQQELLAQAESRRTRRSTRNDRQPTSTWPSLPCSWWRRIATSHT